MARSRMFVFENESFLAYVVSKNFKPKKNVASAIESFVRLYCLSTLVLFPPRKHIAGRHERLLDESNASAEARGQAETTGRNEDRESNAFVPISFLLAFCRFRQWIHSSLGVTKQTTTSVFGALSFADRTAYRCLLPAPSLAKTARSRHLGRCHTTTGSFRRTTASFGLGQL